MWMSPPPWVCYVTEIDYEDDIPPGHEKAPLGPPEPRQIEDVVHALEDAAVEPCFLQESLYPFYPCLACHYHSFFPRVFRSVPGFFCPAFHSFFNPARRFLYASL